MPPSGLEPESSDLKGRRVNQLRYGGPVSLGGPLTATFGDRATPVAVAASDLALGDLPLEPSQAAGRLRHGRHVALLVTPVVELEYNGASDPAIDALGDRE